MAKITESRIVVELDRREIELIRRALRLIDPHGRLVDVHPAKKLLADLED